MLQGTFTLCSPANFNTPAQRTHVAVGLIREAAQVKGLNIPDFPPLQS